MSGTLGPINASALTMQAAADFLGNGAVEINKYETEISDIVRRESKTLTRFKGLGRMVPASGHPHRYFEQTAIAIATATDPRAIAPTPSGPTRVERAVMIKATVAQSNFSHFDVEVTRQQGAFARVEAQDIDDITAAIVRKNGQMLWNGTDTSLTAPVTTEWMGMLSQIVAGGNIAYVNKGASIVDAYKTQVASLMANQTYAPQPSAIYQNPLLANLLDQEAKAVGLHFNKVEFVAGVQVSGIQTQAGELPLPSDPFIPSLDATALSNLGLSSLPSGCTVAYPALIVQENMVEIPYVNPNGNEDPRLFQLGLLSGLQAQYVGLSYSSVVAKAASYAHAVVIVYH